MKIKPALYTLSALLITTFVSQARNIPSPDGQVSVQAEAAISLIDASGQPILTLIRNTASDTRIEVAWSADSTRVVIAENTARGCDVVAAYQEGGTWHKTIQMDEDQSGLIRQVQLEFGARLVSEHETLGAWISQGLLQVHGEMTLSNGRRVPYSYNLQFGLGPIQLDRGGYEEGVVKGQNYKIL